MADVTNLAQVTEGGISCATFPEIKDALARKMQEIYGYDIDLSTASADGQYVMMEALVLNNIYRTLESLVNNLSLASASGKYLDILSSLSGVFRRQATYSTANVYIKNSGSKKESPLYLEFLDKNGNTWQWMNPLNVDGNNQISFDAGSITPIVVTCEDLGPYNAVGGHLLSDGKEISSVFEESLYGSGDIFSCITTSTLLVYQDEDAFIGQSVESDSELRSRRLKSLGQAGTTVLESLRSKLIGIPGVLDCVVYSNNTFNPMDVGGGTVINPNEVFTAISVQPNVSIPNYTIGTIIYNTITPGIVTLGEESCEIKIDKNNTNIVAWRQTTGADVKFLITLSPMSSNTISHQQFRKIFDAVISYLNNLNMNDYFSGYDLAQVVNGADFRNNVYNTATYTCSKIRYCTGNPTSTTPTYDILYDSNTNKVCFLNYTKFYYPTSQYPTISGNEIFFGTKIAFFKS